MTNDERRKMLGLPFEERMEISKNVIKDVLKRAKKPIVQFSGGADSCLLAWLVHEIDPTVPMVFNDWGIFLPRQLEFCEKFFKTYNIQYYIGRNEYNYKTFLTKYGFPIFKGVRPFINPKQFSLYNLTGKCRMLKDRCWKNLLKQYPADYYFVGILADESPQRKSLFIQYGFESKKKDGTTLVKPIELIKKQEIFDLLDKHKILYPKNMYEDTFEEKKFKYTHCDLGCFMCGINFKKYGWGRLGRLAREDNIIFKELMDLGMRDSLYKIIEDFPEKTKYIVEFLKYYDSSTKKTAYDFDGVLMPAIKRGKRYFDQNKAERDLFEKKKRYFFGASKVLKRPLEKEFFIISARRERYRAISENWLERNNIKPKKLILMEGQLTFNKIIEHKHKCLKEMKIEKYYEDDPKIVNKIRKLLPDLEVIQVPQANLAQEDVIIPNNYQLTLEL